MLYILCIDFEVIAEAAHGLSSSFYLFYFAMRLHNKSSAVNLKVICVAWERCAGCDPQGAIFNTYEHFWQ